VVGKIPLLKDDAMVRSFQNLADLGSHLHIRRMPSCSADEKIRQLPPRLLHGFPTPGGNNQSSH
jgi:hypothetical protein